MKEPILVKRIDTRVVSVSSSCYYSSQRFDIQTKRKVSFCIVLTDVLTLLPRSHTFFSKEYIIAGSTVITAITGNWIPARDRAPIM